MWKTLALSLLALALLTGIAGAATTSLCNIVTSPVTFDTIGIALIALSVSFDVVAIGYIIGKIFPDTKVSQWVVGETWEITKSVLLIAAIYSLIVFIGNVSTFLVSPAALSGVVVTGNSNVPGASLIGGACAYLSGEQTYINTAFQNLLALGGSIGTLAKLQIGAYFPVPPIPVSPVIFEFGFVLSPYKNGMINVGTRGAWSSLLGDMLNLVALPVAFIISMQITILPLLFSLGLGVLLPIGLVFRALPFLRGIGGALVAIAIGVSLIYPATLLLFNYPITQVLQAGGTYSPPSASCSLGIFCGVIGQIGAGFTAMGLAFASIQSVYPALNQILTYGTFLMLQFLLFILDLAVVYSLSNNIARTLGGTIRLEFGGKLKLK